jgi:hypothetical protein
MTKWRRKGWARRVVHVEEMKTGYKILVRKPGSKRPLRRPRRRWENNVRINF